MPRPRLETVLPSTSRAVPLNASWPVWPYCMFNHELIHNCDWNFWHCSWSHAESPTTFWICLRLQVERRKGERTVVCLLERTSLYLWIAFSSPHTDGGRSSLHCVGFSAWEDGQSPKIVRDLTIYTILWSRMNLPLAFASSFPEPRIHSTLCPVCSVTLSLDLLLGIQFNLNVLLPGSVASLFRSTKQQPVGSLRFSS